GGGDRLTIDRARDRARLGQLERERGGVQESQGGWDGVDRERDEERDGRERVGGGHDGGVLAVRQVDPGRGAVPADRLEPGPQLPDEQRCDDGAGTLHRHLYGNVLRQREAEGDRVRRPVGVRREHGRRRREAGKGSIDDDVRRLRRRLPARLRGDDQFVATVRELAQVPLEVVV